MAIDNRGSEYPRPLTERERLWMKWILPADRAGYQRHRGRIQSMTVIGEGRRGKGEIILGRVGTLPDFSAPLPPVFAYGAIETDFGVISVTLREELDEQISLEIVSHRGEELPAEFEEGRRWTYSTWKPGEPCPQCVKRVREVAMHTPDHQEFVLAICPNDKRLWIYEKAIGVNHLIPVTNFYNELMLHKNIRDPKIALDSKQLFTDIDMYSDADLTYAFVTYNKLRTKVHVEAAIETDHSERRSFIGRLSSLLLRRKA